MANTDAAGAPKPPPHLHVSENEDKECDNCAHYLDGKCHKYNDLPVNGEWVCDSWEQGRNQDPDEAEEKEAYGPPAKNLRGAERQAFTIVREHRRRVRASGLQSGKPDASDQVK